MMKNIGVSVIIPARNEAKYIGLCIDSILFQNYEGQIEIIVVDNQSTDDTALIARLKGVQVFETSVDSVSGVRNLGRRQSIYPILAFIDGDCVAPCCWLEQAVQALHLDSGLGAFGGPCAPPSFANWVVRAWAPSLKAQGIHRGGVLPGANLVVRKSVFDELGGFDEALVTAEDDDFCQRLNNSGYVVECDFSNAVIHYGYPDNLKGVFLKSVWHGTTQIKAHGYFGDKVVILALLLGIFSIGLFLSLLIISPTMIAINSLGVSVLPSLLAMARIRKCPFLQRIRIFVPAYCISFFVLTGRLVGMVPGIFKEVKTKIMNYLV